MFPQDSTSPVWTPEVTKIPGVLDSGTEERWGDQKLVGSRPEGAKEMPNPSPEASRLVHHFRHLALQERHAARAQPYSAPPRRCHRT